MRFFSRVRAPSAAPPRLAGLTFCERTRRCTQRAHCRCHSALFIRVTLSRTNNRNVHQNYYYYYYCHYKSRLRLHSPSGLRSECVFAHCGAKMTTGSRAGAARARAARRRLFMQVHKLRIICLRRHSFRRSRESVARRIMHSCTGRARLTHGGRSSPVFGSSERCARSTETVSGNKEW